MKDGTRLALEAILTEVAEGKLTVEEGLKDVSTILGIIEGGAVVDFDLEWAVGFDATYRGRVSLGIAGGSSSKSYAVEELQGCREGKAPKLPAGMSAENFRLMVRTVSGWQEASDED